MIKDESAGPVVAPTLQNIVKVLGTIVYTMFI